MCQPDKHVKKEHGYIARVAIDQLCDFAERDLTKMEAGK